MIDYNACHKLIEDIILDILLNNDYNFCKENNFLLAGHPDTLSEFILKNKNFLFEKMHDENYTKNFELCDDDNTLYERQQNLCLPLLDMFPILNCHNDYSDIVSKWLPRLYKIYNENYFEILDLKGELQKLKEDLKK